MDTLNKPKNKHSYRHIDDWLNILFFWKLIPIQNKLDTKTNNLKEIIEEYQVLITIADPSPIQQSRIEEILALAVYDTVLSKLIDRVDQDIAREIGLVEKNDGNVVDFPLCQVSHPIQKKYVGRPHINIASAILGGAVSLLGAYIFNQCNLLGTNYSKQIDSGASSHEHIENHGSKP